jgi:hypothetical protein
MSEGNGRVTYLGREQSTVIAKKEERKLKLLPQTSNERKVKWKQDI